MRAAIYYHGDYEDILIINADTFDELKQIAIAETTKRGWDKDSCWIKITDE